MKQTAVQWLFEKLWNTDKDKFTWYAILKQAKEMEKEQQQIPNNIKQTAVEWLVHELDKQMIERDKFDAFDWIFEDLIKQAEEMEKEQMQFEYMRGLKDGLNKQVTNKN